MRTDTHAAAGWAQCGSERVSSRPGGGSLGEGAGGAEKNWRSVGRGWRRGWGNVSNTRNVQNEAGLSSGRPRHTHQTPKGMGLWVQLGGARGGVGRRAAEREMARMPTWGGGRPSGRAARRQTMVLTAETTETNTDELNTKPPSRRRLRLAAWRQGQLTRCESAGRRASAAAASTRGHAGHAGARLRRRSPMPLACTAPSQRSPVSPPTALAFRPWLATLPRTNLAASAAAPTTASPGTHERPVAIKILIPMSLLFLRNAHG